MGCGGLSQRRTVRVRDLADALDGSQIAAHYCERLFAPSFAGAKQAYGRFVARVARQVEAAQTLEGHNLTGGKPVDCFPDWLGERRAACRAGIRLCVETAVRGILVFLAAGVAERKHCHGRGRAIVGNVAHDGVARSAVGAVGERILVAPVSRVGEFPQAIGAGGKIRRDQGELAAFRGAVPDGESSLAKGGDLAGLRLLNAGQRRRLRDDGA